MDLKDGALYFYYLKRAPPLIEMAIREESIGSRILSAVTLGLRGKFATLVADVNDAFELLLQAAIRIFLHESKLFHFWGKEVLLVEHCEKSGPREKLHIRQDRQRSSRRFTLFDASDIPRTGAAAVGFGRAQYACTRSIFCAGLPIHIRLSNSCPDAGPAGGGPRSDTVPRGMSLWPLWACHDEGCLSARLVLGGSRL